LITITLLAFLVLLLVSLASLTRVETQVAGNSQRLAGARANALFALNVAIGQLQVYAGPDQRVTAPSNAGTTSVSADRSDTQPHWIGVWRDNTPTASSASRELLTWLVSGNEDAANALSVKPTATIADPVSAASDTVWLVNTGTVEFSGAPSASNPDLRIKLPKKELKADTVPGLAAVSGGYTVGRYAWWVGDEGMKARVNLTDPHAAATDSERGFSFSIAQRSAIERVDRAASTTALGAAYPDPSQTSFADLKKVTSTQQLQLISSSASVMRDATRARFHDLTASSFGVLADVAQGGLKKDLSVGLKATATVPLGSATLFTPDGTDDYAVPTWDLLRSFATKQVAVGGSVASQPLVGTKLGTNSVVIGPVVTYVGVGFDYTLAAHAPTDTNIPINFNLMPVVVLWNPYTVALAPGDYTLAIGLRTASSVNVQLRRASSVVADFNVYGSGFLPTATAQNYLRFKVHTTGIPAGQNLIFTLPSTTAAGTVYQPGLTTLVNEINPTLSVIIPSPATAATASEKFDFLVPSVGGSLDVVLTEFDASGSGPTGSTPGTPRWYQAIQQVARGVDNTSNTTPVRSLAVLNDATSAPAFALDVMPAMATGTKVQLPWISHSNPRAVAVTRTKFDLWYDASGTASGTNNSFYFRKVKAPSPWPSFNYDATPRASTGLTLDNNSTPVDVTLWEFPTPEQGLLSLGQLQHANLATLSANPAYAIGNSLADYRIPRDQSSSTAGSGTGNLTSLITTYYDLSWRLNRALWDRYFFSTVPSGFAPGSTLLPNGDVRPAWTQANINSRDPLPNSRIQYYDSPAISTLVADGTAGSDPYNQAAANLLVAGAFNINSTSEQAWRAVLASTYGLGYDPKAQSTSTTLLKAAFARFARPTSDDALSDPWQGYRQLDESQINQLAASIVAEIKKRGPFLSLADFVNRRLANDATGLKGVLQAAIDATTTGAGAVNDAGTSPFNADLVDATPASSAYYLDHMRNDEANTTAAHRSRSAFLPKFLTQADILTTLGPVLTARSDTFLVRAYGESVNPLLAKTDAGYVTGTAWCEAVVQRVPDYVDDALPAETDLSTAPTSAAKTTNLQFGRRFKIISFRWLSSDEI
jgi:hypothetical protein